MTTFVKLNRGDISESAIPDTLVLVSNDWDDYGRKSTFDAHYWTDDAEFIDLGRVKIVQEGFTDGFVPIANSFSFLDDNYASLGQSQRYYESLSQLPKLKRDSILASLKDVAADSDRRARFMIDPAFRGSVMRDISSHQIELFSKILNGAYRADSYSFSYSQPNSEQRLVEFHIDPRSLPSSNLHVIIGRNGVGKTTLLARMAQAACTEDPIFGRFTHANNTQSDNAVPGSVVSISFSAFDTFDVPKDDGTQPLTRRYSYVGLRVLDENRLLSQEEICRAFVDSAKACIFSSRRNDWEKSIGLLHTDQELASRNIIALGKCTDPDEFNEQAFAYFNTLSSGHKIVLLSITKLVELIEDRTIVFLDEPEGHLHPPLLASFVRSISSLLRDRNAIAVIATHSPVVLQEVPGNCSWLVDRAGDILQARRPKIETFAENVGVLTHEVFGLEVTASGHYQVIDDAIKKLGLSTLSDALSAFDDQIGGEGQAIALALMSKYLKKSENS